MIQAVHRVLQLLGCFLLFWSYAASASASGTAGTTAVPPIQMSDVLRGSEVLDGTVEVWQLGLAQETPLAVAALPADTPGGFQTVSARRLQGRFDMEQLWLRLTLHNDLPTLQTARLALRVTWLQHVKFYVVRSEGGSTTWSMKHAGIADPRNAQHTNTRVPQTIIHLAPGETVQVLVHVDSHTFSKLDMVLKTDIQWQWLERDYAMFSGLLIGGMLVFAVSSAALWQISRNSIMAWQTIGLSLVTLYEATYRGFSRVLLWPDSMDWGYRAHHTLVASIMLCLLLYLRARLRQTPAGFPRFSLQLLQAMAGIEAVVLLGALFGPYGWFVVASFIMVFLITLAILVGTCFYHRQGGPGEHAALAIMFIICSSAALRMAGLLLPDLPLVQFFEQYAIVLPGLLVGLFVVINWSYQQSFQRHSAERMLQQWQAQQQQRLEQEVQHKTHALNEALLQAEQRTQEQKVLLAYVSHDLRAPVSVILGHLRLLRSTRADDKAQKLAAIERSAAYQLTLIDELVDYTKQELMPSLALNDQPVALRSLLADLDQFAQALAHRQHNAFTLQVLGTLPEQVYLDVKRLQQAVLNLLSNAAKFTRDGHIGLRIWAEPQDSLRWRLHFEVSDSGAGIPQADLSLMEQALAADTTHAKGGLGLLIAQRIVQRMQGHLTLKSQPGSGTHVAFFLAVEQVPGSPTFQPTALQTAAPSADNGLHRLPAATLATLSVEQKLTLEALASQGNWSDLHAWLDALAHDPHCQPLVHAARLALEQLDFEQIRQIARTTPLRS